MNFSGERRRNDTLQVSTDPEASMYRMSFTYQASAQNGDVRPHAERAHQRLDDSREPDDEQSKGWN